MGNLFIDVRTLQGIEFPLVRLELELIIILLTGSKPINSIEDYQPSSLISEGEHASRGVELQGRYAILFDALFAPRVIAEELGTSIGFYVGVVFAHITFSNDHKFRRNVF